jgi:hypothetical protein
VGGRPVEILLLFHLLQIKSGAGTGRQILIEEPPPSGFSFPLFRVKVTNFMDRPP